MTETKIIKASTTRFMREVPVPALTPALEAGILTRLAEGSGPLSQIRSAAYSALRKIGLPHTSSEEFSFIRVGEFLPNLSFVAPSVAAPSANGGVMSAEIEDLIFPE